MSYAGWLVKAFSKMLVGAVEGSEPETLQQASATIERHYLRMGQEKESM